MDTSEIADRGLGNKKSTYEEPPRPWLQSSADAVSSQRRSSPGRGVYMLVGTTGEDVEARPPSVPPGRKRAHVSNSRFIFVSSLSSVLQQLSLSPLSLAVHSRSSRALLAFDVGRSPHVLPAGAASDFYSTVFKN